LYISFSSDPLCQAVFYALDKVNGYRRLFSITDTSLLHPYAEHERIPVWALALIAGIFPLIVILVWAGAGRKSWFDAQVGLGLSLGLTSTFTNIVKVSVS
jgi:diacylglycerol diphosphate phosphatase/phosphatidate phosphatase